MEVLNPKRVLAVSLADEANHLSQIVRDLFGSAPSPVSTSLAGTTHHVALETQYYKASVPVWLDLIASPAEWAESFLSDEASEVLAVLGGLVVVFALPAQGSSGDELRLLIEHVGRVVNTGLGGWEWDGVRLALGVGEADADDWDELCAEAGLEFVQVGQGPQRRGLNEFRERTGMARVKEALESNDWAQADSPSLSDFGDFERASDGPPDTQVAYLDPEKLDFCFDGADFEGLRRAIWSAGQQDSPAAETSAGGGAQHGDGALGAAADPEGGHPADEAEAVNDDDVVKLERVMRKLQAVRDAGAGMGEAQRKKMAARAVAEAMREL